MSLRHGGGSSHRGHAAEDTTREEFEGHGDNAEAGGVDSDVEITQVVSPTAQGHRVDMDEQTFQNFMRFRQQQVLGPATPLGTMPLSAGQCRWQAARMAVAVVSFPLAPRSLPQSGPGACLQQAFRGAMARTPPLVHMTTASTTTVVAAAPAGWDARDRRYE
ncbi:hypothetical protein PLESTB_001718500 [Pleodorina starrii]|uniref:Uncharacterized protein n=1 Tax=Pleodorina starrii TaxID=330485 RepID=A0A9W6BYW9_9CHLO|nr:hypothetical protein PLESTB_001718500 [Pleodorina starrii]